MEPPRPPQDQAAQQLEALIPVKHAETGICHIVRLSDPWNGQSVKNIKNALAPLTGVPAEDQILLIGPPYKQLRQLDPPLVFSSTSDPAHGPRLDPEQQEQQEGVLRSIYLYNRRTLDGSSSGASVSDDSALRRLLSGRPSVGEAAVPEALQSLVPSSRECSPSVAALLQYERLLSKHVCIGVSLVGRSRGVVEGCVKVVEEVCIQRDAAHVALANLLHHFTSLQHATNSLIDRHHAEQPGQRALLDRLESTLTTLQHKALHPALARAWQEAVRTNPSATEYGVHQEQEGEVNLLHCIPVARLRKWHGEARTSEERLGVWMDKLQQTLAYLSAGVHTMRQQAKGTWGAKSQSDGGSGELAALRVDVESLLTQVDSLREQHAVQEAGLSKAQDCYQEALHIIEQALRRGDGNVGACVAWAEEASRGQVTVLTGMEERDCALSQTAHSLLVSKQQVSNWLAHVLRAISSLQSQIHELRKDVGLGSQALDQAGEGFARLEHYDCLGSAYDAMEAELARRQAYGALFEAVLRCAVHAIASLREDEASARRSFYATQGRHVAGASPLLASICQLDQRPPAFEVRSVKPEARLPMKQDLEGQGPQGLLREYVALRGKAETEKLPELQDALARILGGEGSGREEEEEQWAMAREEADHWRQEAARAHQRVREREAEGQVWEEERDKLAKENEDLRRMVEAGKREEAALHATVAAIPTDKADQAVISPVCERGEASGEALLQQEVRELRAELARAQAMLQSRAEDPRKEQEERQCPPQDQETQTREAEAESTAPFSSCSSSSASSSSLWQEGPIAGVALCEAHEALVRAHRALILAQPLPATLVTATTGAPPACPSSITSSPHLHLTHRGVAAVGHSRGGPRGCGDSVLVDGDGTSLLLDRSTDSLLANNGPTGLAPCCTTAEGSAEGDGAVTAEKVVALAKLVTRLAGHVTNATSSSSPSASSSTTSGCSVGGSSVGVGGQQQQGGAAQGQGDRRRFVMEGFREGDCVLFFPYHPPTHRGRAKAREGQEAQASDVMFGAFNSGCPHHFLVPESVATLARDKGKEPRDCKFLLGRVSKIVRQVVQEGSDPSPYGLRPGFVYNDVYCEPAL